MARASRGTLRFAPTALACSTGVPPFTRAKAISGAENSRRRLRTKRLMRELGQLQRIPHVARRQCGADAPAQLRRERDTHAQRPILGSQCTYDFLVRRSSGHEIRYAVAAAQQS